MSKLIYLLSIKTLKDEYIIDDNIEDKYIESNIMKGQRFIINAILGDDKYKEILNQADNNTLTTQNRTMVEDYIQPILAYYVMSETLFTTAYKFKNLNITENNPNESRYDELVKISKKYLKDCEHYQQLFKDYICLNGISTSNPGKKPTIKTGIYLGESYSRKYKGHNIYIENDDNCEDCD